MPAQLTFLVAAAAVLVGLMFNQFTNLSNKMVQMEARMDTRMVTMGSQFASLNSTMGSQIASMGSQIASMGSQIASMGSQIASMDTRVFQMEAQIASLIESVGGLVESTNIAVSMGPQDELKLLAGGGVPLLAEVPPQHTSGMLHGELLQGMSGGPVMDVHCGVVGIIGEISSTNTAFTNLDEVDAWLLQYENSL